MVWTVSTDKWRTLIGGAGILLKLPTRDTTGRIDFRILGGFASCTSPNLVIGGSTSTGAFSSNTQSYVVDQKSAKATSAALLCGVRFLKNFNPTSSLFASVDYFVANPKFEDVRISDSNGTRTENNSFQQNISLATVNIGLAFRF